MSIRQSGIQRNSSGQEIEYSEFPFTFIRPHAIGNSGNNYVIWQVVSLIPQVFKKPPVFMFDLATYTSLDSPIKLPVKAFFLDNPQEKCSIDEFMSKILVGKYRLTYGSHFQNTFRGSECRCLIGKCNIQILFAFYFCNGQSSLPPCKGTVRFGASLCFPHRSCFPASPVSRQNSGAVPVSGSLSCLFEPLFQLRKLRTQLLWYLEGLLCARRNSWCAWSRITGVRTTQVFVSLRRWPRPCEMPKAA